MKHAGQVIGIVVADTAEHAKAAMLKIKVEYEVRSYIYMHVKLCVSKHTILWTSPMGHIKWNFYRTCTGISVLAYKTHRVRKMAFALADTAEYANAAVLKIKVECEACRTSFGILALCGLLAISNWSHEIKVH